MHKIGDNYRDLQSLEVFLLNNMYLEVRIEEIIQTSVKDTTRLRQRHHIFSRTNACIIRTTVAESEYMYIVYSARGTERKSIYTMISMQI